VFETDQGGAECNGFREFNHQTLFHLGDGLESSGFVGNGIDFFEDLVEVDHGNKEGAGFFYQRLYGLPDVPLLK